MSKHQINPNKWIDLYSDYLFNYTVTRVSDRDIAQDLVQDTFLAALKSMTNFKGRTTKSSSLAKLSVKSLAESVMMT